MTIIASRNQREGKYTGKIRRRHRRSSDWVEPKTAADFTATRAERRQHKLNQSTIKRSIEACRRYARAIVIDLERRQ